MVLFPRRSQSARMETTKKLEKNVMYLKTIFRRDLPCRPQESWPAEDARFGRVPCMRWANQPPNTLHFHYTIPRCSEAVVPK